MALASRNQVDIPSSGVIVRKTGKHKYVYKVLETFRNERGQPTNRRISIGKLDEDTGRLIPNNNYYANYCDTVIACEDLSVDTAGFDCIKTIGGTFLADSLAKNSGLKEILNTVLNSEKSTMVLIAAIHMVLNGNVFEFVEDWCAENILGELKLTSVSSSSLFASITYAERMNFFKHWISLHTEDDEHYAYDVTSFSTYANNIIDAEFGYNRDGEDLPQINFGCYFGQQSALPMFYVTYPGSIVDKSHLQYMMAYNRELGINNVKFIMDKGFCTADNLRFMRSEGYLFMMAADNRSKTISLAIESVRDEISSMRNRFKEGLYGMACKGEYYGVNASLHVFYQPLVAEAKRGNLERKLENAEYKLSSLKTITKTEAKPYRNFFNITISDDGTFFYERNYTAIDAATKNYGYLCLIVNFEITPKEALEVYRRKDSIEKSFDDIKNHIDMKRLRTHRTETTDGKMFCAFIALIIVSLFTNFLRNSQELKLTKHDAFSELSKIRLVVTNDGKRLINPLTKTQRLILNSCALSQQDLIDFVSSANL